jgi:hypothetical protein
MRLIGLAVILAASLALAPLVSEAQQRMKVNRVGVLSPGTPPLGPLDALRQGLRELGYEEGRTFSIEWRFPGATDERLSNWTRHAGRERRPVYNGVLLEDAKRARGSGTTTGIQSWYYSPSCRW